MKSFKDLKTAYKLALGFGLCLTLAAIVGGVAVSRMAQMNKITKVIVTDSLPSAIQGGQLSEYGRQFRLNEYRHLLTTDATGKAKIQAHLDAAQADMDTALADYGKDIASEEDRAAWESTKDLWAQYLKQHTQFLPLSQRNDTKHGTALLDGPLANTFDQLSTKIDALTNYNKKNGETLSTVATSTYSTARVFVIALVALAIVLGFIIAWSITRYIVGMLGQVSNRLEELRGDTISNLDAGLKAAALGDVNAEVKSNTASLNINTTDEFGALAQTFNTLLHQVNSSIGSFDVMMAGQKEKVEIATYIADGDLTHRITVKSDKDTLGKAFVQMSASLAEKVEVAKLIANGDLNCHVEPKSEKDALGHAFVQMIDSLSTLVSQATQAANTIAASSSEVSAGNEDLSQRTEEQASSLEETAASMEEMTATVKQNADNARQANQFASQARTVAEKGGSVVESAVTAMSNISSSSKRIADIISVIDEIAFQTNLLALNAAVEAARVGEQGRGFAVVAAEVRNLAGRSATAAKEIKALVLDSVQKVEDGSELVNQSGEQLREIVTSVKKVADIIAEISAAGQEQAIGIEQVNKAIMQMDQITQQNASLVEEASATSQVMNQQAISLQIVVAQFKINSKYQSAQQQPIAQKATGTYGHTSRRPSTNRSSSASLKLVNEDEKDFEEF